MARYFEVIDVKEDMAIDLMILERGQDPERLEMIMKPEGAYKLRRIPKDELGEKVREWLEFYKGESMPGERIGTVGVDSGMLLISDPCYIKEGLEEKLEAIYEKTNNELKAAEANRFDLAFLTGYGDGLYDVYAKRDSEGRIVKIEISFD
jgi:hypothetical protein